MKQKVLTPGSLPTAGTSASDDPDKGRIGTIGAIGNAGGLYAASHINRIRTAGVVTASFATSTASFAGSDTGATSAGGTQIQQNLTTLLSNVPQPVLDPSVRDQVLSDAAAAKSKADADRLDVVIQIDGLKEELTDFRQFVLDGVSELREEIQGNVHSIQLAADVAVVAAQVVAQGVVLVYRAATDVALRQTAAEFQAEKQKYVAFRDASYQQMFDARQDAWEGRIATSQLLNAADEDIAKRQQAIRDQFAARRADRLAMWESRIWALAKEMAGSGATARDLLYDPDYQTDWTPFLDSIENALDVAGMLPVVGIVPDLINVAFTASRGKWGTAGFNLVAAIPGIGDALKGGKMLAVAGTTGSGIIAIVIKKNGDEALEKALKIGEDVVKQADDAKGFVDNAVKEIDDVVAPERVSPNIVNEAIPKLPLPSQSLFSMPFAKWGSEVVEWGRGAKGALDRIGTLTKDRVGELGLTRTQAEATLKFYQNEFQRNRGNATAEARVKLMEHILSLLD